MAYGPTDRYFSELENSDFQQEITSNHHSEDTWRMAKESESLLNEKHTNSDKASYNHIRNRKQLLVNVAKYNSGLTDAGKKRIGPKKREKVHGEKKVSMCKKPNAEEKNVSFSGRERRALVWSGESFTSINPNYNSCKSDNAKTSEQRKDVTKKCTVMRLHFDQTSVRRKRYYKRGIHIPGVYSCDKCGRQYRYMRGLRQHQRDSCISNMNTTV